MTKKHNDNNEYLKNWSTKKLKQEAINYDEIINKTESYGSKDMVNFTKICQELEDRGIEINTKITFN